MEDQLHVHFCDLCNTSVPDADLASGAAARAKGRVVGACCLGEFGAARREPASAARSGGGVVALGVVLLAAIASAALFLDWRITEELGAVRTHLRGIESVQQGSQQRLRDLDTLLGATATRADLAALAALVGELQSTIRDRAAILAALEQQLGSGAGLGDRIESLEAAQAASASALEDLRRELRALGADLTADLAAVASAAKALQAAAVGGAAGPAARATPEPALAARPLPPSLQKEIGRLADEDPGTRFEAVAALLESKNPAVLPELVAMLEDPDLFVRRLTAEGLRNFKAPAAIEALLAALDDPEPIVRHYAHGSLVELTGESFGFDPEGRPQARQRAQRRWQEWWAAHRAQF